MQKAIRTLIALTIIVAMAGVVKAQLLDNYDGVGGLTYTTEGTWVISNGKFEAQTGGTTEPEHSYASYDLTLSNSTWSLSKDKQNEWIGWMDLNRDIVSGWGANYYSCGMVLAANSADFNESTTKGYAIGFRDSDDQLVLFRFNTGIVSGTKELPGAASIVVESGYTYANVDNGVNFYVKLESNGKWTVKYKKGDPFSDENATNPSNYIDGSVTSSVAEETYSGTSYKYAGWVYAHSSGSSDKAYFDNFGIGTVDQSLPVILGSFFATVAPSSIFLSWSTESEIENMGFNIYRKLLGGDYSLLISFLDNPALAGHGTTTKAHTYSYTDKSVQPGATYTYLLSDVSYAGVEKKHTDKEVTVTVPEGVGQVAGKYKLENIYPNPFNPSFTVPLTLSENQLVEIVLYDSRGNVVCTLKNEVLSAGSYKFTYTTPDLPSGIYFVRVRIGECFEMRKIVLVK